MHPVKNFRSSVRLFSGPVAGECWFASRGKDTSVTFFR